jgi:hypothetical protein
MEANALNYGDLLVELVARRAPVDVVVGYSIRDEAFLLRGRAAVRQRAATTNPVGIRAGSSTAAAVSVPCTGLGDPAARPAAIVAG